MSTTRTTRSIQAPADTVFDAVADIRNFSTIIDGIVKVEFLSDQRQGAGTRFTETRLMNGREASTVLEVTEYDRPNRVRLVADQGGTIWDTEFTVTRSEGSTVLVMTMEARAYQWLAKILNPLIRGVVRRAIEKDMDAVKTWCELVSAADSPV